MLLRNISSKIVCVGSEMLLPDEEKNIRNDIADTPAVKALCELGILKGKAEKKAVKPVEAKEEHFVEERPVEEANPEAEELTEAMEEKAASKKTGRRTTKEK